MERTEDDRAAIGELVKLPNVGPATAEDLLILGIRSKDELKDKDPDAMYLDLCTRTGARQDPCVRDVFAALVDHANGAPARPWWYYTPERKSRS